MGKTSKNLAFVLGLATLAFGGYYAFTQFGQSTSFSTNEQNMQNMLNNTRVFIERGEILNRMQLGKNIAILEDERFNSLQNYSTPIIAQPISRPDPFAPANQTSNINSADNNE
jgi:hypothetical protein